MPATYDITGHLFSVQPLATCSKDLRDRAGGPEKPVPVPSMQFGSEAVHLYFPGTGIRGTLRRAARDVLRARESARCGNPKPFSLDQHYLLTLGGIKGVAEANRASVAVEAAWRERNPLLSLFGAGDAGVLGFVEGRLSVGNAICDKPCEPVVFSGARTDDLYRDKAQLAYLSDEDLDSLVARSQGNRSRAALQRQLKDLEGALKRNRGDVEKAEGLRAQIAELEARIGDVKKATGAADVSVGMPLAGWQAIPPGHLLTHRMILAQSTEVELGLLLYAMNEFALSPVLGAHYAAGCGLVSGAWEITQVGREGRQPLGHISFEPLAPLAVHGESLTAAMRAFDEWMASDAPDFAIPHMDGAEA